MLSFTTTEAQLHHSSIASKKKLTAILITCDDAPTSSQYADFYEKLQSNITIEDHIALEILQSLEKAGLIRRQDSELLQPDNTGYWGWKRHPQ